MNTEEWKKLWDLFHEAAGLPADLRRDWLAAQHDLGGELRAELSALLDYHARRDTPLDRAPVPEVAGPAPGETIGPWRVLRALGAGGSGVVYLAERCDGAFERRVAIKILEPLIAGGAFAAGFARERRILANLDHPGIARLLDAGQSPEGWLYLVMEYAAGQPLATHCRVDQPNWQECLGLYLKICDAVAYAHRKLVVHGDLKPANIVLQTEPEGSEMQPKLLDFGIARLLSEHHKATAMANGRSYTPGYASPEQIAGRPLEIGTDIFALGILLFEMLAGKLPFTSGSESKFTPAPEAVLENSTSTADYLAAVRRGPPSLVSVTGRRDLPLELDWIIARCLSFAAEDRYLNVDRLARDLRALGKHLPVYARPPTHAYLARKFMRRNRRWIAGGGVIALIVFTLGVLLALEVQRTANALSASERHLRRAETTAEFLSALFAGADFTRNAGKAPDARALLDQGRLRLANNQTLDPQVHYSLNIALAEVYSNLGDYPSALELAREALQWAAEKGDAEQGVEARLMLGRILFLNGDLNASREQLKQTAELLATPQPARLMARVHLAYGTTLQHLGDLPTAGEQFAAAEKLIRTAVPEDDALQAEVLLRSGSWHWSNGDLQQAATQYARAIAAHRRLPNRNLPELAHAMDAHASALYALGRYPEAAAEYAETIALRRTVLGEKHRFTADSLSNLGALFYDMGRDEDAETALSEALAIYDEALTAGNPLIAKTLNNLGLVLLRRGHPNEAERLFQRALDIHQAAFGRDHLNVAGNLNNLGLAFEARAEWEKALAYYQQSLQIQERILSADHPARGYALTNMGRVSFYLDRRVATQELFREAYELRRSVLKEGHPALAQTLLWWGIANCVWHRSEVALSQLAQANLIFTTRLTTDHPDILTARGALAACRLAHSAGQNDEAAVERRHWQALLQNRMPTDPLIGVLRGLVKTEGK